MALEPGVHSEGPGSGVHAAKVLRVADVLAQPTILTGMNPNAARCCFLLRLNKTEGLTG